MIDLLARPIDAGDRRDQIAWPYGTDVRRIVGAKEDNKPRIQAWHAVPGERVEIIAYWME
jgi:hypothetical protein